MTKVSLPVVDVFSVFPRVVLREFDKESITRVKEIQIGGFQGLLLQIAYLDDIEGKSYSEVLVVGEIYDLTQALNVDPNYYKIRYRHPSYVGKN